jgi:CRISPR/Cas system CMR-associated protein Cmr1 (group 7 of RAMP superfamily)
MAMGGIGRRMRTGCGTLSLTIILPTQSTAEKFAYDNFMRTHASSDCARVKVRGPGLV